MQLTDGRDFNVWDVMEEWAASLQADQHQEYLEACEQLVAPHRQHHRFRILYSGLRARRGVSETDYPGLDPNVEPEAFDVTENGEDVARWWPRFWLTHFGEHMAAEECDCDRRLSPSAEGLEWWEDGERGERILMAQLGCLIPAAGGTPEAVPVFRSMMESWPDSFESLVSVSSRLAVEPKPPET